MVEILLICGNNASAKTQTFGGDWTANGYTLMTAYYLILNIDVLPISTISQYPASGWTKVDRAEEKERGREDESKSNGFLLFPSFSFGIFLAAVHLRIEQSQLSTIYLFRFQSLQSLMEQPLLYRSLPFLTDSRWIPDGFPTDSLTTSAGFVPFSIVFSLTFLFVSAINSRGL